MDKDILHCEKMECINTYMAFDVPGAQAWIVLITVTMGLAIWGKVGNFILGFPFQAWKYLWICLGGWDFYLEVTKMYYEYYEFITTHNLRFWILHSLMVVNFDGNVWHRS